MAADGAIYLNGIIYTVAGDDWDNNPREAIVVSNGTIQYVGTNQEAREKFESGMFHMNICSNSKSVILFSNTVM